MVTCQNFLREIAGTEFRMLRAHSPGLRRNLQCLKKLHSSAGTKVSRSDAARLTSPHPQHTDFRPPSSGPCKLNEGHVESIKKQTNGATNAMRNFRVADDATPSLRITSLGEYDM